jgi:hypothetical protein
MLEGSVRHRYQSAEEVLRALDIEPYLDSLAKGWRLNLPLIIKSDRSIGLNRPLLLVVPAVHQVAPPLRLLLR